MVLLRRDDAGVRLETLRSGPVPAIVLFDLRPHRRSYSLVDVSVDLFVDAPLGVPLRRSLGVTRVSFGSLTFFSPPPPLGDLVIVARKIVLVASSLLLISVLVGTPAAVSVAAVIVFVESVVVVVRLFVSPRLVPFLVARVGRRGSTSGRRVTLVMFGLRFDLVYVKILGMMVVDVFDPGRNFNDHSFPVTDIETNLVHRRFHFNSNIGFG